MKPRRLQSETSTSMFTGLSRRSSRSSAFSRKALDLAHEARRSHRLADEQGDLAVEELTELVFGTAQSHPDRLVPGQTAQAPERRDAPAPESQEAGHRVRARLAHEATGLHVHDQWPASEAIAPATAPARVRSEERRVGKECRCRWGRWGEEEKSGGKRAREEGTELVSSTSQSIA